MFIFMTELVSPTVVGILFILSAFGLWKLSEKQGAESFQRTFYIVLPSRGWQQGKILFLYLFIEIFDSYGRSSGWL